MKGPTSKSQPQGRPPSAQVRSFCCQQPRFYWTVCKH
jgi:hypothetical protein